MKLPVLLLLLFFSPLVVNAQMQPMDGTDCTRQFFTALQEKNTDALDNLLTSDFSVVSFNGQTINGEQLKQALREEMIAIESGMLSGANTRNYRDVAVVTGLWNIRARFQNASFQGELAYMTVCVRSAGRWQVSALQLTPLR